MKLLLVYPEFNQQKNKLGSFLNKLITRKQTEPVELIEISIQLPISWERKLINLNTTHLKKEDLLWADYIVIKASEQQSKSALDLILKCNKLDKKIILEGELFDQVNDFSKLETLYLSQHDLDTMIEELKPEPRSRILKVKLSSLPPFKTNSDYSTIGFAGNFLRSLQFFHT